METNYSTKYTEWCNQSYEYINHKIKELNKLAYIPEEELYKLTKAVADIKEKEKEMYANMSSKEMQDALFHKIIFETLYHSVDLAVESLHKRNAAWIENMNTLPRMN